MHKNKIVFVLTLVTLNLLSLTFQIKAQNLSASETAVNSSAAPHRQQRQKFSELESEPLARIGNTNVAPQLVGGIDANFAANVSEGASTVYAVAAQSDGKILLGGFFSGVNGVSRGSLERLNADGTRDTSFNPGGAGANSSVYVIIVLPTGKILIGGAFTTYNGANAPRVARLNADGTLDTTFTAQGTGLNGAAQDIVLQPDGKILMSGSFTSFNGVVRNNVARINADGTLDTTFNPNVNSFTEELILQPDGKIFIGGAFTSVGGVARFGAARLNADGTLDTGFNVGSGVGFNGDIGAIYAAERQPDGKILIGGSFTDYNGVLRSNVARLNTDGSLDTSFNPNTGGKGAEFFAVQPDGRIVVVGAFGSSNFGALRLNADGSTDTSFALNAVDDFGYAVGLQADGKILIGGLFKLYGGASRSNFVRLNTNGTLDSAAATFTIDPNVRAIAQQPDGKILVGGQFRSAGGAARINLARFNSDGTLDTSFDPGTNVTAFNTPTVYAIAVQPDGKILVGGSFSFVNGSQYNYVLRLNSNGSVDTTFNYFDAVIIVRDIKVQPDGKILLGGFFDNFNLSVSSGIVRINSNGSYDTSFNNSNGANSTVIKIELLPNGQIYLGGSFTTYGGTSRNRIARINSNGMLDTAFNPGTGANSTVYDIVPLANGQLYVGGFFTIFNAVTNNDVVRLNANGTVDSAFSTGATGLNGGVYALSLEPDGKLLAGGNFIDYNGTPVNRLVALNSNGSLDTTFNSLGTGAASYVWELFRQTDGKTLVGGFFNSPRNALFRLNADNAVRRPLFDYDGDGRADVSVFRPASGTWYVQRSTAGFLAQQWGANGDLIAPADFDGDGKTDLAVFRPANGFWYIFNLANGGVTARQFGQSGDVPRPADFDGDGRADLAVFRPSTGTWYRLSSSNNQTIATQFGESNDAPLAADFDGDGRADLAVFRPSTGFWYRLQSSNNQTIAAQFGQSGDVPSPGDYDGDGRADLAVFRPASGFWYAVNSSNSTVTARQFGQTNDAAAAADYDGDGKTDLAVFRPSSGVWYQQLSMSGFASTQFGQAGDVPTPSAFTQP